MAFKDMVAADREAVFLSVDFFGEMYEVDGKLIPIVIDTDELKERQGGQDLAVAESATLFYAKREDIPKNCAPGYTLIVNGRACTVDALQENQGIVTVVLRENITA